MKPRRICFYAVATHLGGAERSVLELMKGLQAHPELGYRPWMILPKADGPLVRKLAEDGIEYDVLAMPENFLKLSRSADLSAIPAALKLVPGMALYLLRLVSLIRKKRPALLHTNAIKCHGLAAILAPVLRIPVLWHLRDLLPEGPALWGLRALRKSAPIHLVANSTATAESFSRKPGDVHVIHNGLDPEIFKPLPNRVFHAALGIAPEVPLVGIIGVLARWKGQLEFLRMARRLVDRGSKASFVIVGGEIYDTAGDKGFGLKLRREARRLGIADRVLFTGFRENTVEAVNGLDVLVHASIRPEPFGRVVIEAMACGVPAVATAAGGILEIIEHEVNGMLVPPGDSEAMARDVQFLLENSELRNRIVGRGRNDFLERFTSDRHVEAVARVYNLMLGKT